MQLREPGRCAIWAWAHELIAQGFVPGRRAGARPDGAEGSPGMQARPRAMASHLANRFLGLLTGDRKALAEARQAATATTTFADATRAEKAQAELLEAEADFALGVTGAEATLRRRVEAMAEAGDAGLRSAIARSRQALVVAALGRGDGRTALAELARLQRTASPTVAPPASSATSRARAGSPWDRMDRCARHSPPPARHRRCPRRNWRGWGPVPPPSPSSQREIARRVPRSPTPWPGRSGRRGDAAGAPGGRSD